MDHDATNGENFAMGSMAAAATVCVMIPLDTVKTRIVTQVGLWAGRQGLMFGLPLAGEILWVGRDWWVRHTVMAYCIGPSL
jgi:hypothetical protein